MNSEIRLATIEDIPRLKILFQEHYRYNPLMQSQDYLLWQFFYSPNNQTGLFTLFVILDGDKIIGCLGYVPLEFRMKEVVQIGGWTHHWVVSRHNVGGLQLFAELASVCDNLFHLGMTKESATIFRLFQVPVLERMPRWVAVTDAAAVARLCGMELAEDRRILKESSTCLASLKKGFSDIEICKQLDPKMQFSLDHWPDIEGYALRSGRFLNWRYVEIPGHTYKILRGSRGVAVYRIEKIMHHEVAVARIVEWTFKGEDSGLALTILCDDPDFNDGILIDFFCTATAIGEDLTCYGFFPEGLTSKPIPDRFRPMNHSGGIRVAIDLPPHRTLRCLDFSRWYLTKGDSDIDRVKL